MRLRVVYIIPVLALAAGVSLALGGGVLSEHGPIPSVTGAPAIRSKAAELNCTLCHLNFDWNNLNTPGGSVEILGLPRAYAPGQTYRIHVRISTDSTKVFLDRDWGFELTAVRASDGEGCGTFVLDDPDTLQIVSGASGDRSDLASRWYVQHTANGVRNGISSPVEWTFSWQAPATPQDSALFYCAGNAANGNLDSGGDFVFTAAETVLDSVTTPVRPMSWGAVKRRYRD